MTTGSIVGATLGVLLLGVIPNLLLLAGLALLLLASAIKLWRHDRLAWSRPRRCSRLTLPESGRSIGRWYWRSDGRRPKPVAWGVSWRTPWPSAVADGAAIAPGGAEPHRCSGRRDTKV